MKRFINPGVMVAGLAWFLSSCANDVGFTPAAAAPASDSPGSSSMGKGGRALTTPAPSLARKSRVLRERTGIATGFGRELDSAVNYTNFTRSSSTPNYVTRIRYNDSEGAKAMGVNRGTKASGMQKAAGGLIEWGMSSGWGLLESYRWQGERFVIGKKGREYQLKVKNLSSTRVEVVLSVDGLDVTDGKAGSTQKRGYIIDAGKSLSVKGFRTSHDSVASFKFSSVSSSYANLKHGNTRNVGVVGLALFTEKGREPWVETMQRGGARAFAEAPDGRARN